MSSVIGEYNKPIAIASTLEGYFQGMSVTGSEACGVRNEVREWPDQATAMGREQPMLVVYFIFLAFMSARSADRIRSLLFFPSRG